MVNELRTRLEVSRAAMTQLKNPDGAALLERKGLTDGMLLLAVLYEDPIREVHERLQQHSNGGKLAMIRGKDMFTLTMTPLSEDELAAPLPESIEDFGNIFGHPQKYPCQRPHNRHA